MVSLSLKEPSVVNFGERVDSLGENMYLKQAEAIISLTEILFFSVLEI